MLPTAEPDYFRMAIEIILWTVPTGLAVRAGLRSGEGRRAVWWVIALACSVITLDKAFDFQILVYRAAKEWVGVLAPGLTSDGGHPLARIALLGALFLIGSGALYWLVRSDRSIDGPKLISLLGLMLVMAYLGLRLAPGLKEALTPAGGHAIELACWGLVVTGTIRARDQRRTKSGRRRVRRSESTSG